MHFIKTLAAAMVVCSLGHADINLDQQLYHCPSRSEPDPVYNLSLQAIQSNFIEGDYYAGNNGQPIVGQNIPTIFQVEVHSRRDETHLHIKPFTFTLAATGFMISQNLIPVDNAPKSARWVTFDAGSGVEGHVFRDGSIRFSGPDGAALAAGTYSVPATRVSYGTRFYPSHAEGFFQNDHQGLVRDENFPISEGQSNLGGMPANINNGTDYAEYYGMTFYDSRIYTSTTDNSFDPTTTPIAVFNKVNKHGKHSFPQVDIVPPGFANFPVPPSTDSFQLTEETISINPLNKNQLATSIWTYHDPEPTMPAAFLFVTNDGGQNWNLVDAFAGLTLPGLPGYLGPLAASNQYCIYDNNGNLFYTTLCVFLSTIDFTTITLAEYVLMSPDNGATWQLVDFVTGIDPDTFGLDFPVLGTGVGPNGSAVTWLMIKQDANYPEIVHYGSTLPLIAAAYQTTGNGVLGAITHQEVPGSEVGGFGSISVGPNGETLIVGFSVNNRDGSLPFANSRIWTSFNKDGLFGTFKTAKTAANSNTGYRPQYLPEQHRGTSPRPQGAIDKDGRWYITYVDQTSPHYVNTNANVYLIYSDDHGKHWSSPLRINNDVGNTTYHIIPEISVDPISGDLAITWLDSREDEQDVRTRLWGTVIKHHTLPKLRH